MFFKKKPQRFIPSLFAPYYKPQLLTEQVRRLFIHIPRFSLETKTLYERFQKGFGSAIHSIQFVNLTQLLEKPVSQLNFGNPENLIKMDINAFNKPLISFEKMDLQDILKAQSQLLENLLEEQKLRLNAELANEYDILKRKNIARLKKVAEKEYNQT